MSMCTEIHKPMRVNRQVGVSSPIKGADSLIEESIVIQGVVYHWYVVFTTAYEEVAVIGA